MATILRFLLFIFALLVAVVTAAPVPELPCPAKVNDRCVIVHRSLQDNINSLSADPRYLGTDLVAERTAPADNDARRGGCQRTGDGRCIPDYGSFRNDQEHKTSLPPRRYIDDNLIGQPLPEAELDPNGLYARRETESGVDAALELFDPFGGSGGSGNREGSVTVDDPEDLGSTGGMDMVGRRDLAYQEAPTHPSCPKDRRCRTYKRSGATLKALRPPTLGDWLHFGS